MLMANQWSLLPGRRQSVAAERSVRVADLLQRHLPSRAKVVRDRYERYLQELEFYGLIWVRSVSSSGLLDVSATMRGRNALCRLRSFERQLH